MANLHDGPDHDPYSTTASFKSLKFLGFFHDRVVVLFVYLPLWNDREGHFQLLEAAAPLQVMPGMCKPLC